MGGFSAETMYRFGYQDAVEDIRSYLQHLYSAGGVDPATASYHAGWNAAIDRVAEDSLAWPLPEAGGEREGQS